MDQNYWDKFYDTKLASYYFQFYAQMAKRKKTCISAICILASSAFLFQMAQTSSFRPVWLVIVFLCQLVSILQPLFPFEKQYHAACYIYEDVNQLSSDIETYWRSISDETSDEELNRRIAFFSEKYDRIESRFASPDLFPHNEKVYSTAKKNTDKYFMRFNDEYKRHKKDEFRQQASF